MKESRGEGSGVWRNSTIIPVKEVRRGLGVTMAVGRMWELERRELEGEQQLGNNTVREKSFCE